MLELLRRIRSRFLNKMLLLFTAVSFVIFLSVTLIITNLVSTVLAERDDRYNQLVLVNLNDYMQQRLDNIHKLVMLINSQELQPNDPVFRFLQNTPQTSDDYISDFNNFKRFVNSLFSFDRYICGISVYKKIDSQILSITRAKTGIYVADPLQNRDVIDLSNSQTQSILIGPAAFNSEIRRYSYVLSTNLKTLNVYNNVAVLCFDMDTDGISKLISSYYQKPYGEICVVTRDNEVIFSSSGKYYGVAFPIQHDQLQIKDKVLDGKRIYVHEYSLNEAGLSMVQLIPQGLGNESVFYINSTVIVGLLLSVLFTSFFTFSIGRIFSKRILRLTEYYARVQAGDLSGRIPIDRSEDEITMISRGFNKMCENLEKYIENEYVLELNHKDYEMKLKNTEIISLQSQINPHFMYNSLEMIRMKANKDGARAAGDMILVLSKLLRNSIKENILITIGEEIDIAKLFVRLYSLKYENLKAEFDFDQTLLGFAIIRNTIQPLLENAIVHGYRSDGTFQIIVSATLTPDSEGLLITIADNGKGIPQDELQKISRELLDSQDANIASINNARVGLSNVNNRLRLIFGDNSGINLRSAIHEGTIVDIRLPAKTVKELEGDV
jgi:two-component system, sensor histidine kinase YesM